MLKILKRYTGLAVMAAALISFLFAPSVIRAYAAPSSKNRTLKVKLKKDYEQGTFEVTVKGGGRYNVTLAAPKGGSYDEIKTYKCDKVDNSFYRKTISGVNAGTWKIKVKAVKGSIKGDVKVSFSSNPEQSTDIVDNIKIGKNINGLKYYMSDRTLHVEWTDETVGTVDIIVTNLDNNEQIASDSVDSLSYSVDIPDDVTRISVEVTPATSEGIKGASKVFNVDTRHTFLANVLFTENEFTNENSTVATVKVAEDGYGIIVYVGDVKILSKDSLSEGEYDVTIPLDNIGKNEVKVYIVDKNGNRKSYTKTIYLDTTPPDVKFSKNYDGMTVPNGKFTIDGRISDYSSFTVNDGNDVKVEEDGHFSYVINVHNGANQYDFVATDEAGNKATYSVKLTGGGNRVTGGSSKGLLYLMILIVVIAVLLLRKKKKPAVPVTGTDEISKPKRNSKADIKNRMDDIRRAAAREKGYEQRHDARQNRQPQRPANRNSSVNNIQRRNASKDNGPGDLNIRKIGDLAKDDDDE